MVRRPRSLHRFAPAPAALLSGAALPLRSLLCEQGLAPLLARQCTMVYRHGLRALEGTPFVITCFRRSSVGVSSFAYRGPRS